MAKNKTAIAIALFLMATIAITLVAFPPVNADVVSRKTHIYVTPQPVTGINQEMFIIYWLDLMPVPETDEELAAGIRGAYHDITLTITKPDQTTETLEMGPTDPVGGGYYLYTPDQTGDYSVIASFPGNWRNSSVSNPYAPPPADAWYEPSESVPQTFTVQDEPIAKWPEAPLPTDYWERPISGASHLWAAIAGNWLGGAAQQWPQGAGGTSRFGYGAAPESPHILWTRQHYPTGSLLDERFGVEVHTLNHYQDVDFDGVDLILDGVIHYTPQYTGHWGAGIAAGSFGWGGISLYTGELLFLDPEAIKPSFGQIYIYNSPNQHGGFAYLWRTSGVTLPDNVTREPFFAPPETVSLTSQPGTQTWEMIDAFTGNRVCYVANVSAGGTAVYGKDGSILRYNTVNYGTTASPNYYLQVWNSSAMPTMLAGDSSTWVWQWRPQWGGHSNYGFRWRENVNAFHDGSTGFSLNVSIPNIEGPRNTRVNQTASIRVVREGEYVILATSGFNDDQGTAQARVIALSLEPGKEGTKLWETTFTPPYAENWAAGFDAGMLLANIYPEDEVIVYNNRIELKWWAYDMKTGQLLWESEPEDAFHYYSMSGLIYEGKLLTYGRAGGVLRAYDIRTGDINWTYTAEGAGTESPYGNALVSGAFISDGKIYFGSSEHSASTPLWRTPGLRCLNATTGEELWKILFWGSDLAVADGILVGFNWYDGQVYGFGKGPSATTVTAPELIPTVGDSVMLTGMVTDQTPTGRRNINNEVQFTLEGTPAIADEDMQAWMQYKFMEQGYPADAKGVEVILETLDPNGNFYEIGRTTSDINGNYGLKFTPPVPGEYQIFATFKGSKSYYPSTSSTYMSVAESPQATSTPTPPPPAMTDTYVIGFGSAALVAIIVIGVILILLRRR